MIELMIIGYSHCGEICSPLNADNDFNNVCVQRSDCAASGLREEKNVQMNPRRLWLGVLI